MIATLKGGWGKCGNESLLGGFWALRVEFGDAFFFQTASLDASIAMVGSDHPFDGRMGRLGRKGVFGYNLGLGAKKRLTCADRLKMGETFTCEKTGKIGDDRLIRMEMGRAEPIGTTSTGHKS